ncbi:hypothetical protein B0H13DRAFT_1869747 [Mycena leptocephala]|nr:hypothetical protein B0H13DRAFT_1869747 [Mycena leptocephala]
MWRGGAAGPHGERDGECGSTYCGLPSPGCENNNLKAIADHLAVVAAASPTPSREVVARVASLIGNVTSLFAPTATKVNRGLGLVGWLKSKRAPQLASNGQLATSRPPGTVLPPRCLQCADSTLIPRTSPIRSQREKRLGWYELAKFPPGLRGRTEDIALVRLFKKSAWRPKTVWKNCRIFEDERTMFILPQYFVRGAHKVNWLGCNKEAHTFYLDDIVDFDWLLRAGN